MTPNGFGYLVEMLAIAIANITENVTWQLAINIYIAWTFHNILASNVSDMARDVLGTW